jgi:excinuclease ABC subunit B
VKVVKLPVKGKNVSRPHKPHLDEMGIALFHEVAPARSGKRELPRKPTLDEMGPGRESKPYRPGVPAEAPGAKAGPRSTTGKPGMHGGWKPRPR